MRKPSLSLETFVTALAVLGAASGCSKAEKASAAPESAVAPATPPTDQAGAATTPSATATAAAQTDTDTPQAAAPSVVAKPAAAPRKKDDTAKHSGAPGAPANDKPVNASCGAGTCTPDMKKGNGN